MTDLGDLGPLAQLRAGRLTRRLVQLMVGLWFFGSALGMIIGSGLGQGPWDVFHYGVAQHVPLTIGTVSILTGTLLLLLWIPLVEKPGIATVLNVVVVGVAIDVTLFLLPPDPPLAGRIALLVGGILLNGLGSAMYIGCRLGTGPRDGLMTGISRKTGWSFRTVRTGIELTALAVGWLLGGIVGIGTVLYALLIGPLTQAFLPRWTVDLAPVPARSEPSDG